LGCLSGSGSLLCRALESVLSEGLLMVKRPLFQMLLAGGFMPHPSVIFRLEILLLMSMLFWEHSAVEHLSLITSKSLHSTLPDWFSKSVTAGDAFLLVLLVEINK
jgi:hypothetical protein